MIKNILFFFSIFILSSCSEKIEFKNLAIQKAIEMDCKDDVELLVKNEGIRIFHICYVLPMSIMRGSVPALS